MKIDELQPAGLVLITPDVFEDSRGYFFETYHEERFRRAGIEHRFVQDNQSGSTRGVLRGLHAQLVRPQGKLVRVASGAVFDVALDIRPASPAFGSWAGIELSADNRRQLWIPPGFAHGFCALSDVAEVVYKCTELYDRDDEIGVRWNDPAIGIDWPIADPLLSDKDAGLPLLADLRPRLEAAASEALASETGDPTLSPA